MSKDIEFTENNLILSACLIVKNEEHFLGQCLESIKNYVDEIVVVDTGSTDSTVEIAQSFGARVYAHPWDNNFSKHRNQSIGYARGKWILYIDADEELVKGGGERLRRCVAKAPDKFDAISVVMECVFDEGKSRGYNNAIRVFRNKTDIFFRGRVHNYLVGVRNVSCSAIHIFHHGYNLDQEGRSRKFERTTKLLKMDIAENPVDPRPHHFLSASYLSEGMHEEAIVEAETAISLFEKGDPSVNSNYYWSLYIASTAALRTGNVEKAERLAEKGARLCPKHLDSYYVLCLVAYERKDLGAFEKHFGQFLNTKQLFHSQPEQFGEMVHNSIGSEWQLHLLMSFLLLDEEMEDRARIEIESALSFCPNRAGVHKSLGRYYLERERFVDSEPHLRKAVQLHADDLPSLKSLAFVYEKLGKHEEQSIQLECFVDRNPEDYEAWFALGLSYIRLGRYRAGEKAFFRAETLDPLNPRPKINRSLCLNEMGRFNEAAKTLKGLRVSDHALKVLILTNLGISNMGSGHLDEAEAAFSELEHLDARNLEAPVFLSWIHVQRGALEACVKKCEKLMNLLDMGISMMIDSVGDLGGIYLKIAKRLFTDTPKTALAKKCLDVCLALSGKNAFLNVEVGRALIDMGDAKKGAKVLKSALVLSPCDEKIRKMVLTAINAYQGHSADPATGIC